MRFEVWTSVGPRNHVLGWEPDPPGEGEILGRHHPEHCKVYGISRVCHSYSTAAMRPFAAIRCESYSMCSLRSVSSLFVIFVVCWYWGTTMCWQLLWLPAFKIPKLIPVLRHFRPDMPGLWDWNPGGTCFHEINLFHGRLTRLFLHQDWLYKLLTITDSSESELLRYLQILVSFALYFFWISVVD